MSQINEYVNIENFKEEVLDSDIPVLVDFYATWCGPCKMLSPILHEIADEHDEFKICKIDVDAHMDLAAKYNVASIPTLLVFKNGELVNRQTGFRSKDDVVDLVK